MKRTRNLKCEKNEGQDRIESEMLKNASVNIIDYLSVLFNRLCNIDTFPSE